MAGGADLWRARYLAVFVAGVLAREWRLLLDRSLPMSVADDTLAAINDPETLTDICAAVAIGGTLAAFCEQRALSYKLINRWIQDDESRAARYEIALTIRDQHARDLIIAELVAYLRADVTSCFDEDGNLRSMPNIGPNEKRLIAGVKFREIFETQDSLVDDGDGGLKKEKKKVHVGNIIEIKFWDKPRSIETFMRHLSMLVDRKVVDVGISLADLIAPKPKETV